MQRTTFELTNNHIKLLKNMYVGWQDCETGAPEIDPKRPYGNSDVANDINEILEYYDDADFGHAARKNLLLLHKETKIALQIVLTTGKFQPGQYKLMCGIKWELSNG